MTEVQSMDPVVENLKTENRGYELTCEYKNFPVTFVNGIRRMLLSGVPTVVVKDVQILENTTQLPHEMMKHRVEMLPVNVSPDDASTIRDTTIELRMTAEKDMNITTDDFVVQSNRSKILARDRDYDTPILFLRLRPKESVHIKASLGIDTKSVTQVMLATTMWHVDADIAKEERKKWEEEGKDPIVFDNFQVQRYYSKDPVSGRPNWIDMKVESVGILPAKDILKYALSALRKQLESYMKEALENIARESEANTYSITLEQGGHTIGSLLQEVLYNDANIDFVGYDIPHPLRSTMVLRLSTKGSPEKILRMAAETVYEYCSLVEKVL
jgi:DNA-directed RNA polymerase subunit L